MIEKIKFHDNRKLIIFYLIAIILFFIINGIIENCLIKRKINSFKSSGKLVLDDKENGLKVYCVSRETNKPSLTIDENNYYIGQRGDILTKKSFFVDIPVIHELATYFIGGHAGLVVNKDETIEVIGYSEYSKVSIYDNDWFELDEVIGLRLKNSEIVTDVCNNAIDKLGENYNYSFVLDTGYYCTDLISKSVYEADNKSRLNDGFVVTVNDLILSKDVEICYYHYTDSNGIRYVYYID